MNLAHLDRHRKLVTTRRGDVSYLDTGSVDQPAALLVHGVGTNAYLWRNVIAELAEERSPDRRVGPGGGASADHGTEERRVVALDLPLHGRSPAPADGDYSLAALADTVAAFCEALDLSDVDLVANDTGGAVAQIFVARHPERLRTFTLTNCDTHDNVPPPAFQPTVDLARAGELAPGAPALMANMAVARAAVFGSGYEHPDQLDLDVVRAYLEPVIGTPERARAFEQLLAKLEPDDLLAVEPLLREFTVPTLVVWGTGDEFFELRWAYWLRGTIPGVDDVVELDGAKLFFPDERAAELVSHLRRHWAAVPEGTRA